MDAKKCLEQYAESKIIIKSLVDELNQEYEMYKDATEMNTSKHVLNEIEKAIKTLSNSANEHFDKMKFVHNLLFGIPLYDGDIIQVLHLRYVQEKTWAEVASIFSESIRQVQRYHEKGLKIVQNMLDSM